MRLAWRRRLAHEGDPELIWLAVSVASLAARGVVRAVALAKCPSFG